MIENLAALRARLAADRAGFADPFADGDARQLAGKALHCGDPAAPDGLQRALHIRCGTDIRDTLALAGFSGDFLVFYDSSRWPVQIRKVAWW